MNPLAPLPPFHEQGLADHFQDINRKHSNTTTMRLSFTFLFSICIGSMWAQTISIIDGFAAACSGTLFDSGGPSGGGYSGGEDWTLVFCSETPGYALRLEWVSLNLAPGDFIEIYDGPDATAFFFGQLNSGNDGVTVQSSYDNVIANGQGCLTLRFVSGIGNSGSFQASISCFIPCAPPTADATVQGSADTAKVCVGEEVLFDGSSSTPAAGFNLADFDWEFGDGSENGDGPSITHAYSVPGEYTVNLQVTDDAGCESVNGIELQVVVNDLPIAVATIVAPSTGSACQGEQITFSGSGSTTTQPVEIVGYSWNFGDVLEGTGEVVEHAYSVTGDFEVDLQVIDENGCTSVNDINLPVVVNATPYFAFEASEVITGPIEVLLGTTYSFAVEAIPNGSYVWNLPQDWSTMDSTEAELSTLVAGLIDTTTISVQIIDTLTGCTNTLVDTVIINGTVGLLTEDRQGEVRVAPNPGNDLFLITNVSAPAHFVLLDAVGGTVLDLGVQTGSFSVDSTPLSMGTYFLLQRDGVNRRAVPIVVQK